MHKRSALWNPSSSTEISLNHLWWVITLPGWAKGRLGPQSRLEGTGEKAQCQSFRVGAPRSQNNRTTAKRSWCTKLERLTSVSRIHSGGPSCQLCNSVSYFGIFLVCNRTPISYWVSWITSIPPTGGHCQGLDRASGEQLKLGSQARALNSNKNRSAQRAPQQKCWMHQRG